MSRPLPALGAWQLRLLGLLVLTLLTLVALAGARLAQTLPDSPLIGTLGYGGIFLLTTCSSATLFIPAPAFGAVGVAGGVLNPVLVALAAGAGAATGEMTGYLVGRSGRMVLGGQQVGWIERIRNLVDRHGFLGLFLLAAIPNPFFDAAGIAAGSLGYSPGRYWITVALGKSVAYLAVALIGNALTPQPS